MYNIKIESFATHEEVTSRMLELKTVSNMLVICHGATEDVVQEIRDERSSNHPPCGEHSMFNVFTFHGAFGIGLSQDIPSVRAIIKSKCPKDFMLIIGVAS